MKDQEITEEEGWLGACSSSACLEVLHQPDGSVLIRNNQDKTVFLAASREEWDQFVAAVHEGRIA